VEVTDDLCCEPIHNCTVYGDKCGECTVVCDAGEIENHNKVCVTPVPYCANHHDNGDCNYCESGYKVASDDSKVCVPEMPNCAE
jgi:hypothetical protein